MRAPLLLLAAAIPLGCSLSDLDDLTAGATAGEPSARCAPSQHCAAGQDCCAAYVIPAGRFPLGRGGAGSSDAWPDGDPDEQPVRDARIAAFTLDAYEVTVGRFRPFVAEYETFIASVRAGDGAHPRIPDSGWPSDVEAERPETREKLLANLYCGPAATWTATAGTNDGRPINCVTWPVAFLFCLWDGGRLPTEAEWEYAAAGGARNQLFPWGDRPPTDATRGEVGLTGCQTPGMCRITDVPHAGAHPRDRGRFGHLDLAAGVAEWVLDRYHPEIAALSPQVCDNCANLTLMTGASRVRRGGSFESTTADAARAANRSGVPFAGLYDESGIRCARAAP